MKSDTQHIGAPTRQSGSVSAVPGVMIHPCYEVLGVMGEDATGPLYRARNTAENRYVALRLFTGQVRPTPLNTAEAPVVLSNLIGVIDVLESDEGTPFAVMELPNGISLDKVLKRQKSFPPAVAVHIALHVSRMARALHVHEKVHGHLNGNNIFLKRMPGGQLDVQLLYHELLGPPSMCNETACLSPELVAGQDALSPGDDCWAVLVLLYQMLLGKWPFHGPTREDTIRQILGGVISPPGGFEKEHPQLADLLHTGLAINPAERFESGRELNLALKSLLSVVRHETESINVADPSRPPVRYPAPRTRLSGSDSPTPVSTPVIRENSCNEFSITASMPAAVPPENQATSPPRSRESFGDLNDLIDDSPAIDSPSDDSPALVSCDPRSVLARETDIVLYQGNEVDLTLPCIQTIRLAQEEKQYVRRSRLARVLASLLVLTLIGGTIYTVVPNSFIESQTSVKPAAKQPIATEPSPVAAMVVEPVSVPMPEDTVTIELAQLPSKAVMLVNGEPAVFPLTVQKSADKLVVQGFVGDRLIYSATVIPSENRTLSIPDIEQTVRRERRKKKADTVGAPSESSAKRASGSLSSNPYQLRKNPFATGQQP